MRAGEKTVSGYLPALNTRFQIVKTETVKATEPPKATEIPKATETPEPSETPEVTGTPDMTDGPEVTENPEPSETPAVTKEPLTDRRNLKASLKEEGFPDTLYTATYGFTCKVSLLGI